MAKRSDHLSGRFKIYESNRSGLEFGFQPLTSYPNNYSRLAGKPVRDQGLEVAPSEFDQPPPSQKPLGGHGDISGDVRSNSNFSTESNVYVIPPESSKIIQYVTASGGITWNTQPWIYIVGSNSNVVLSADPQINAGIQGQQITLFGLGSTVTVHTGDGLTLIRNFSIGSGGLLNLIYSATDNLWHETSRSSLYDDLGAL